MAGPRQSSSRGREWIALGTALASAAIPGCSPKVGAARTPPPGGDRRRGPSDDRPGHGRADRDNAHSRRSRSEPASAGSSRRSISRRAPRSRRASSCSSSTRSPSRPSSPTPRRIAQAEATLKKARTPSARGRAGPGRGGPVDARAGRGRGAREQILYKRNSSSLEDVQTSKPSARRTRRKSRRTGPASTRPIPTMRRPSSPPGPGPRAKRVTDTKIDLSYCRMYSPIDGRIGLAQVKLGNLVGPATGGGSSDYTELGVVRQLDPMGVNIRPRPGISTG